MPLTPGTTLGPYSVTAKIGEGGMGEVYQARDTKLDRDVALKVLPEAFTADLDRLARFEREAKVLGSLSARGTRRAPVIRFARTFIVRRNEDGPVGQQADRLASRH